MADAKKDTAEVSTTGGERPDQHQYATDGTNKGRVMVTPRPAGEVGEYGAGKGKARIPPPFAPDTNMDDPNMGGYRARPAGGK